MSAPEHDRISFYAEVQLIFGSVYTVQVSCILHVSGLSPWRPRWTSAVGQCIQGILGCISSLSLETSLNFCCRTVYTGNTCLYLVSLPGDLVVLLLEDLLLPPQLLRLLAHHLHQESQRQEKADVKEVLQYIGSVKRLFTIFLFHTVNLTNMLVCPWLTD